MYKNVLARNTAVREETPPAIGWAKPLRRAGDSPVPAVILGTANGSREETCALNNSAMYTKLSNCR